MRDTFCTISGNQAAGVLFDRVRVANSFTTRLFGMAAGKGRTLPAMMFPRCSAVHMMGMDRPLDIVSLEELWPNHYVVLGVDTVRPWGRVPRHAHTTDILEAEAGSCEGIPLVPMQLLRVDYEEVEG